ncbi:hypothetical protein IFM89_036788 [Coptis chinensis]|uniref:DUF4283 domain-containing protein n=1 Tax=Coptis chinensis TaxID=261450 RepID=A0A835HMD5_9MAGN|nr:hypothetical protein IFM89_036788 [Coptis chinensis]
MLEANKNNILNRSSLSSSTSLTFPDPKCKCCNAHSQRRGIRISRSQRLYDESFTRPVFVPDMPSSYPAVPDVIEIGSTETSIQKNGFIEAQQHLTSHPRLNSSFGSEISYRNGFLHGSRIFIIRPWSEDLETDRDNLKTVPIWVKLHDVPKILWTKHGMSFIASRLGKPHCWDAASQKRSRLDYARACVEVLVDSLYPTYLKFRLGGKIVTVGVEYSWKPTSCTHYQIFGHNIAKCPKQIPRAVPSTPRTTNPPRTNSDTNSSQVIATRVNSSVWQQVGPRSASIVNSTRVTEVAALTTQATEASIPVHDALEETQAIPLIDPQPLHQEPIAPAIVDLPLAITEEHNQGISIVVDLNNPFSVLEDTENDIPLEGNLTDIVPYTSTDVPPHETIEDPVVLENQYVDEHLIYNEIEDIQTEESMDTSLVFSDHLVKEKTIPNVNSVPLTRNQKQLNRKASKSVANGPLLQSQQQQNPSSS